MSNRGGDILYKNELGADRAQKIEESIREKWKRDFFHETTTCVEREKLQICAQITE